ncbi:MAG: cupredoxin domain-containing protein [Chloroflexi bacterium]|nr:cupredoxin domain-containing protein [Chloroflexota bacterium]
MRSLLLIPILLVAAACGGSASPTPGQTVNLGTASAPAATGQVVPITVKDFTLEPLTLTVKGSRFSLAVTNAGPTVHNVTIRDGSGTVVQASKDLREGQSEVVSVNLPNGTYVLFCSLPGHESLGIKGTLVVEP